MSWRSDHWQISIPVGEGLETFADLMTDVLDHGLQEIEWMICNKWVDPTECARENEKRPAYIRLHCPDDWVTNLHGMGGFRDTYLMVRIPIEMIERRQRERSGAQNAEAKQTEVPSDVASGPVPSTGGED